MKNTIQKFSIQDCLALIIACCISPSALSEVTLDGSVGAAGALSGPNYQITEDVGQRAGSNLLHSFGQFNLNNTESATFSGSAGIQNVIGRVTGGQASSIDGTLRVTIPDANLYLLNPAGILFGQNAKLDVPGSFHASTADLLKFQDGVQFETGAATPNPILTTALPEAFGFLGENPAGISVTGGNNTTLEVPNGEMISLVGGDITIKDSSLYAPGGQINLASVGSAGDVVVTELGLDTASFERMGNISISQDPLVPRVTIAPEMPAIANVDVSADTAGKVFIRGGQMVMDNANILSDTTNGDGRGIDIGLTGDLNINGIAETPEIDSAPQNGITTDSLGNGNGGNINLDVYGLKLTHGTRIDSTASSSGNGGDLNINANSILLEGNQSNAVPRFITGTTATGNAGNITINNADNIELSDSAFILSSTAAEGNTGVITINTDALNVRGNASIQSFIGETGKGDGGSLTVNANSVDVQTKGLIRSITLGKGDSGDIAIDTGTLEIHDDAQIISTVLESGDGNAGNLSINASSVKVHNKGGIASVTSGKGNAGNLAIDADVLQVHDTSIISNRVSETGDGNGGHLLVSAGSLDVSKNAAILNTTDGQGNAGDLTINANSLKVNDGKITNHTNSSGDAGNLKIKTGSLEFLGGVIGTLSAEDATGTNGNITIEANSIFMAGDNQNASQITGTVLGNNDTGNLTVISDRLEIKDRAIIDISNAGSGNTGNLLVDANEIVITNNAGGVNGIAANLTPGATGNSGGLTVKSQNLVMQNGARISAANFGSGNGGNLNVEATESIVVEGTSETTARNSSINNEAFSSGQTGDLTISTKNLQIQDNGEISTTTVGPVNGGNMTITADDLKVQDRGQIRTGTLSTGHGGELKLDIDHIEVSNESVIATSTLGAGNAGNATINAIKMEMKDNAIIATNTDGAGMGGILTINVDDLLLNGSALASASSFVDFDSDNEPNTARSGDLFITSNGSIRLENNSSITTFTDKANAGKVEIIGKGRLQLHDGSKILTNVADGKGIGGDVFINTSIVALDDESFINARAVEGFGGNITISGFLFQSPNSVITASSELSKDGELNLKPDTNISGSIAELPDIYMNAANQLSERCADRSGTNLSSFVVKGRNGVPVAPGDLTPSNFTDYPPVKEPLSPETSNKGHKDYGSIDNKLASVHVGLDNRYQLFPSVSGCAE